MINDFIDGDKFKFLADIDLTKPNDIEIQPYKKYIIYTDTHLYEAALSFIKINLNNNFILITHNSDDPVVETEVPKNVIKWFAQNVEFSHSKIIPIPIGLERDMWHPHKKNILFNTTTQTKNRKIKALSQFNPATFPQERSQLLLNIINGLVYSDMFRCLNGERFELYVDNLRKYAFCLCPRGNGIDTHRMWEALYLGCIPIVKKHITHNFEESLPIIFIDSWLEVTEQFLLEKIKTIDYSLFNSPLLTMSYWKERIINEKNQY